MCIDCVALAGTVCVKTSVLKDGHTFTVHILDPKVKGQEEEPAEATKVEGGEGAADGPEKRGNCAKCGRST